MWLSGGVLAYLLHPKINPNHTRKKRANKTKNIKLFKSVAMCFKCLYFYSWSGAILKFTDNTAKPSQGNPQKQLT